MAATTGVAKLSVVGIGMRSHAGVASRLFACLGEAGVNIQLISTSEIKIAVVIDEGELDAPRGQRMPPSGWRSRARCSVRCPADFPASSAHQSALRTAHATTIALESTVVPNEWPNSPGYLTGRT